MPPTQLFQMMHGDRFFYIRYFQQPQVPEAEFEANVRDSLLSIYVMNSANSTAELRQAARTRKHGYLDGIEVPELPPWLTEEALGVYVEAFEHSGFRGGLNRYRNMDSDWHSLSHFESTPIEQPALFLAGEHDSVLRYAPGVNLLDLMKPYYRDLRGQVVIPGAGHWVQQEAPEAVNAALLEWLRGL